MQEEPTCAVELQGVSLTVLCCVLRLPEPPIDPRLYGGGQALEVLEPEGFVETKSASPVATEGADEAAQLSGAAGAEGDGASPEERATELVRGGTPFFSCSCGALGLMGCVMGAGGSGGG
jgi:hypothetical protein